MMHPFARLTLAAAAGLLCAAAVLLGLDPAALRVAWARPLANVITVTSTNDPGPGALRSVPAAANVITVTNTTDHDPGSLSAALLAANAGDTIQFNVPPSSTITLTSGELVVNQPLTIDGSTAVNLAVSGNFASRVFNVGAPLTVKALTIEFGNTAGEGGGILSNSALTLTNVSFLLNNAAYGGGVDAEGGATLNGGSFSLNGSTIGAGGLYVNGPLTMTGTSFVSNHAPTLGGGGFVLGPATLSGGSFVANSCSASGCFGGGLEADGTLALSGTLFIGNTALAGAGGAYAIGAATVSGGLFASNSCSASNCRGGGLFAANTLALTGTNFIGNAAAGIGGGAVVAGAATLNGGQFQINKATAGSGGGLYVTGTLALTGTQFLTNTAGDSGGGLYAVNTLALSGTNFISNTAINGGGGGALASGAATVSGGLFQNNSSANGNGGGLNAISTLNLTGTQFLSNTADYSGGGASTGIATLAGALFAANRCTGSNCTGGGFYAAAAPFALTGTQFLGNTAAQGGGLYLDQFGSGGRRVVNALFARNVATDTTGAALYLNAPGNMQILFTTIAGTLQAGSAIHIALGTVGITDTIVSGYETGINNAGGSLYEAYNEYFGVDNPFLGAHSGGAGDVFFSDPLFVDRAHDNYHLTPGSPAIGAGVDAGVHTDLDGRPRPVGGRFDIGAYEFPSVVRRLFLPLIVRECPGGGRRGTLVSCII